MTVEQSEHTAVADQIDDFNEGPVNIDQQFDDSGDFDPQDTSGDDKIGPDAATANQPGEGAPQQQPAARQQPEPPAAPQFEPDLLASVGMTAEEAASEFGSNEELAKYDAFFNRRLYQQASAQLQQQQASQPVEAGAQQAQPTNQPAQPAQAAPPAQPTQQQPPAQPQGDGLELPELPIDMDRWDDDTKEHLIKPIQEWVGQVFQRLAPNVQQMQQTVQTLDSAYQSQMREQYHAAFEDAIESLGDDWTQVLGKGTLQEIKPEELKARQDLDAAARLLNQTRQQSGLPPMPLKRAVQMVVGFAFPDRTREITRRHVTGEVLKRTGQFTARPSAKTTSGQTGLERASEVADKFYEDRGIPVSPMPAEADSF